MLFALFMNSPSLAQNATTTQLEIGPIGSNQVTDGANIHSGAIGTNNIVQSPRSLAVGSNNEVWQTFSLALGAGNSISKNWGQYWQDGYNLTVGQSNHCTATFSAIVGTSNYIEGNSFYGDYDTLPGATHNLLVGAGNSSSGHVAFLFGTGNSVGGYSLEDSTHPSSTAVLGHGLISEWSHSVMVGRYNDASLPRNSGLVFAVGNGQSNIVRSNALEVYDSGKIVMPRQGDVLMGDFGHTEP